MFSLSKPVGIENMINTITSFLCFILRNSYTSSNTLPNEYQQFDISQHVKYENRLHSMKGQTETAFVPTVILFGILGSYLFLHIWENMS